MQKTELKNKDVKELKKELAEKREKLQGLHFDLVSGKIKSAKGVRETRKEIARILTAINSIEVSK